MKEKMLLPHVSHFDYGGVIGLPPSDTLLIVVTCANGWYEGGQILRKTGIGCTSPLFNYEIDQFTGSPSESATDPPRMTLKNSCGEIVIFLREGWPGIRTEDFLRVLYPENDVVRCRYELVEESTGRDIDKGLNI